MLIREVLDIHKAHRAESNHIDILGDPYLVQFNPVYRQVKRRAVHIGANYIEAYPRYLLMPFYELSAIVASKNIPYVPSARLLQEVEDKRPGTFTIDEVRLPESYHLHEAAHVIAEDLFKSTVLQSDHEKILKAILCESFANTVDALACVPAVDETHRFFLEYNCYMKPNKKNMAVMARLTEHLGFRCTFMLTLFAYVHANFLKEGLPSRFIRELVDRYALGVKLSDKLLKDCEYLGCIGEKLDPQFRVLTTANYFKAEGFDGDICDLLDFRFMDTFKANAGFTSVTEAMSEIF